MRGRRRSPQGLPPPPGSFRREERRYPTAPRERRRRSLTPDRFRRGGSPPPYKRGRYGRDTDEFFPPRGGYDQGQYGRPSPPPRRDGPRPYKDFCRTLPDDVTPEQAQKEYQQYLSEYWGSAVRADFESKKNEDWMRSRFDPRGMTKAMEERNAEAQAAAMAFSEDLKSGALDPKSAKFKQGLMAKDMKEEGRDKDASLNDAEGDKKAESEMTEAEDDEDADDDKADASVELVSKEEGAATAGKPEGVKNEEPSDEKDKDKKEANGKAGPMEDTKMAEPTAVPEDKDAVKAGTSEGDENMDSKNDDAPAADTGTLDLQLTYLWRVHGVDYYAGRELADPMQFKLRLDGKRMLRGPRPEEGEQAPQAEEKKGKKAAEKQIDLVWKKRISDGDPFEASLQQEKISSTLEEWVEEQVRKIDDNKWGCKLSQKLFVGKDYVLKHIKLKHTEKMEEHRSKICDDIFWQNYKKFRDEEQKMMQAELAKMQQAMQMQQAGNLPMPWEGSNPPAVRGLPQMIPAAAALPGPVFPGAGAMMAMGMGMAPPVLPRSLGNTMLPGGMLPQPGQVLVLAPGAGPMGPFVSLPISEAAGYGRVALGPGRGMPGGRGSGRGGRFNPGFGGAPPPRPPPRMAGRDYFDLDNPSNNRSVLDYGDL